MSLNLNGNPGYPAQLPQSTIIVPPGALNSNTGDGSGLGPLNLSLPTPPSTDMLSLSQNTIMLPPPSGNPMKMLMRAHHRVKSEFRDSLSPEQKQLSDELDDRLKLSRMLGEEPSPETRRLQHIFKKSLSVQQKMMYGRMHELGKNIQQLAVNLRQNSNLLGNQGCCPNGSCPACAPGFNRLA